jgi:acetyltransferase
LITSAPWHSSRSRLTRARIQDPESFEAEFAILVRSDLKGHGLGKALLSKLMDYCKARGIQRLVGEVLTDNVRMLHLAQECGFHAEYLGSGTVRVSIDLQGSP